MEQERKSYDVNIQIQSVIFNNEKSSLVRSLESISNAVRVAENEYGQFLRLVVVYGDASKKATFSEVELAELRGKLHERIELKYHYFNTNTGSAKGNNLIANETDFPYMLILNPDIILSPHYFYYALLPFKMNKLIGMVEARQTPIEHQKEYDKKSFETEWATTACAVIRRDIFNRLNGFDAQTFFLYCDDLDFSWRMRLLGYKIFYQPFAPVFHDKTLGVDGSWQPSESEIYYSALASLMLAYKWSNPERVNMLLNCYKSDKSIAYERRAAQEFIRRKYEGILPEPIDPTHKVARFVGNYYTENRFVL